MIMQVLKNERGTKMLQFDQFVARHGEVAAQALLENIERFEGRRSNTVLPLEQRWEHTVLRAFETQQLAA